MVVRVHGVGSCGVWCAGCIGGALPFNGLVGEGDFRGALREYREGLGSRAAQFEGLRLDPFDDEVRGILGGLDGALRGCAYHRGGEVGGACVLWPGMGRDVDPNANPNPNAPDARDFPDCKPGCI